MRFPKKANDRETLFSLSFLALVFVMFVSLNYADLIAGCWKLNPSFCNCVDFNHLRDIGDQPCPDPNGVKQCVLQPCAGSECQCYYNYQTLNQNRDQFVDAGPGENGEDSYALIGHINCYQLWVCKPDCVNNNCALNNNNIWVCPDYDLDGAACVGPPGG